MSREIKYRVWDNENKSYNDPYSHSYYAMTQDGEIDFYCHGDHWGSCDPDVYFIEQYTGLTDKNGKEIYENCELDGRYRVEYITPKFVGKDIIKGDIIELYDNKFTITKEHCEISQNSERGIN